MQPPVKRYRAPELCMTDASCTPGSETYTLLHALGILHTKNIILPMPWSGLWRVDHMVHVIRIVPKRILPTPALGLWRGLRCRATSSSASSSTSSSMSSWAVPSGFRAFSPPPRPWPGMATHVPERRALQRALPLRPWPGMATHAPERRALQ